MCVPPVHGYHLERLLFLQYPASHSSALNVPNRSKLSSCAWLRLDSFEVGLVRISWLISWIKQVFSPPIIPNLWIFSHRVHRWRMLKARRERKSRQSWCVFSIPPSICVFLFFFGSIIVGRESRTTLISSTSVHYDLGPFFSPRRIFYCLLLRSSESL
jgi:hypothetical protein